MPSIKRHSHTCSAVRSCLSWLTCCQKDTDGSWWSICSVSSKEAKPEGAHRK